MTWKPEYRLRRRMLAAVRRYMVLPRFEDQNLVDELMRAVRETLPITQGDSNAEAEPQVRSADQQRPDGR
ncbi:MAG: hypothetical protein WD929_01915 [Steroidobacteraceae bacterium]